jgi:hypothetical protein
LPVHGIFLQGSSQKTGSNRDEIGGFTRVCAGERIAWTYESVSFENGRAPGSVLCRSDLCLVDYASVAASHEKNLLVSIRQQSANLLLCPAAYRPATRALIAVSVTDAVRDYLECAVGFCRGVGASVVILALADTDEQTSSLTDLIEEALGDLGRFCDYDSLAGRQSAAALTRIAHWRGCQLLVTRTGRRPRWLSWLQSGDREYSQAAAGGLALIEMNSSLTQD